MQLEVFPLADYSRIRSQVEFALRARTAVFIEVPKTELPRIREAVDLDRNVPSSFIARLRALFRLPHISGGLVGDFFMIYIFAKRQGMSARFESLNDKDGVLFVPR